MPRSWHATLQIAIARPMHLFEMTTTHPRVLARGTRMEVRDRVQATTTNARVLVYAPGLWEDWIEGELANAAIVQSCRSFAMAVAALLDDPPPRAQVLVVDFDALSALDLVALCSLRERGWFGAVVAVGDVDPGLAYAASITHVLRPPCKTGALRAALEVGTRHDEVTTPIPCLPY